MPQQRSGRGTRPTTDRVRESLFNVLGARVDFPGLRVLDLYAGSGALGLEALSRGAASAIFVESDARAAAVIERNIAALGAQGAVVRRGAVAAVLAGGAARPVDLVFADPPYEVDAAEVDEVARGAGRRRLDRAGHGGGARAARVGARDRLARRVVGVAVAPLRGHPRRVRPRSR